MFIGHFGVALAAKRLAPRTSLGTLILAAQFLDLLWPIFLLLGLEHVRISPGITKVQAFDFYDYPYSHSLTMTLRWALVVGLIYYLVRRYVRGAWVLALLVISHWILDYVTHRPDLPIWIGGPKVGLGLWNSWPGSIVVEGALFALGLWLYIDKTRARDSIGSSAFWGLTIFLVLAWLVALLAPPPAEVHQIAVAGLAVWALVLWAWWADSHRELTGSS